MRPEHDDLSPQLGPRLATWNVESIRARHDQIIEWLAANEPDVLAMQETRCPARLFPTSEFARLGYELVIYGGDGGHGGVAVAVRATDDELGAVRSVDLGIPGAVAPLDQPRSISLTWRHWRIHSIYAPNGGKAGTDKHRIKLAWFALLRQWLALERTDHTNCIVLGDLNIAPADIDVWDARRYRMRNLTSPPEREAFAALVDDGLVDVVRSRYPDLPVFTWWNRRADFYETNRGWRLDHILTDPETAEQVDAVWVDREERGREGSTDHAPVVLDLVSSRSSAHDEDVAATPLVGSGPT